MSEKQAAEALLVLKRQLASGGPEIVLSREEGQAILDWARPMMEIASSAAASDGEAVDWGVFGELLDLATDVAAEIARGRYGHSQPITIFDEPGADAGHSPLAGRTYIPTPAGTVNYWSEREWPAAEVDTMSGAYTDDPPSDRSYTDDSSGGGGGGGGSSSDE